jgi:hypothetical protein
MPRRPASADWLGTPEQALKLLRVEYSYLTAAPAARLCGRPISRHIAHVRALRSIPGSYARRLGVLCAAAPESSRRAIKEAFSALLSPADAAEMRGTADGTEYAFEVTVSGAEGFYPADQVILDSTAPTARGAGSSPTAGASRLTGRAPRSSGSRSSARRGMPGRRAWPCA